MKTNFQKYMNKNNIIYNLYERHFIAQITNKNNLIKKLQSDTITLYCGFDPTADSLHIGHLMPLLCLRKFQKTGHHPIILLGGATGLIGDPSFKNSKRKIHPIETIQKWVEKIKDQISLFIDCSAHKNTPYFVNNYDWHSSISMLTFLRKIGNFFSVNKMISKDSIKKRLQENNCSISYAEFSYNIMQSYDFNYLYKNYKAILQIGGSDQWGNIVSGIDLIRRIHNKNTYGLTIPLITKPDNTKFGKTEKNTIWLDHKKTSPYEFYQYWMNVTDKKVYHFLYCFTELDIQTINNLKMDNYVHQNKSEAQNILATEITQLVHGKKGLNSAQRITHNLFNKNILQLTANDFTQLIQDGISNIILEKHSTLEEALVKSKLANSYTRAKELIQSNSVSINGKKNNIEKYIFHINDKLYNRYTLLKKGKKNHCLIQWQ